jgi:hypothetical protein
MSKGEYAGAGFIAGLLLAIGVDPVDMIIEILKDIFMSFYGIVSSVVILTGLLLLSIYEVLNQAEPVITAVEAYNEKGEFGLIAFFLGFMGGLTITIIPLAGVLFLIV